MALNPRRPAFRLPWSGEGDEPEASTTAEGSSATDAEAAAPESAGGEATGTPASANGVAPSDGPPAAAAPAAAAPGEPSESTEFLRNLVDAMRGVAETSRDANLAELRASVDAHVEELHAAAAETADELRRRSELDIDGVGEWERSEAERIRAEAERRRATRRAQLEQQLKEHQGASDRQVEATRRLLAEHERELETFFTQLESIADPAAFVAAAKRMPRPPELPRAARGATPAVPTDAPADAPATGPAADPRLTAMGIGAGAVDTAADEATDEGTDEGGTAAGEPTQAPSTSRLAERLAELDARLSGSVEDFPPEPGLVQPAAGAPAGATSAATPSAPAAAGGDTSTAIVVKGLGSFGAITSFKQALERVEGIRGVTLSLGPTGEFVYRASHGPDFDLAAAIRTIEGDAASIDNAEGSLLVTVSRGR
jgi:hypothetical protein